MPPLYGDKQAIWFEKDGHGRFTSQLMAALTWNINGFYLAAKGRLPEALESIQKGQRIDPRSAPRRMELTKCYNWMRQHGPAIDEARKALDLDPNFSQAYVELAKALTQRELYQQALAEWRKAPSSVQGNPLFLGQIGCTHAMAGQRADAEKVIEVLKVMNPRYGCAFGIAQIHAALGEKVQAFPWLEKACDERHSRVVYLKVDPTWDNIRSDGRFDDLLQKMRLADKPTPTRSASEGTEHPIDTLAVLPFTYQSGDADSEFLAEGIPNSVSTSLAQIRTLKVRPESSVSRVKDQAADDLFAAGKALQVQALVTGKIQKLGERLIVTWQLAAVRVRECSPRHVLAGAEPGKSSCPCHRFAARQPSQPGRLAASNPSA